MLIAITLLAVVAGVALLGAHVAADTARGSSTDGWMLRGPHSLH